MNGPIEQQLRDALRRTEAPDGFAGRVMASLPPTRKHTSKVFWYQAIAAMLAVLFLFGGIQYREHERRAAARQTERQVVFAIALTIEKLDRVNGKLQKSAADLPLPGQKGEQE